MKLEFLVSLPKPVPLIGSAWGSNPSLGFLTVPEKWVENKEKPRTLEDETKSNRKKVNHRLLKCCLNKPHCVWVVSHFHTFLVNEWASTAYLEAIWYYISKALKMPFAPSKTILANFSKRTYMNVNKDLPTGLFISFIYDSPNLDTTRNMSIRGDWFY